MASAKQIIKKIEQDLQISFNESPISNTYDTVKGVITELRITNVHFENFDVLSPLFQTLKKLEIHWGCTFNEATLSENLNKFTALENLSVETTSINTAQNILGLENLKKLAVWIKVDPGSHSKETYDLNFIALRNLQKLSLSCQSEKDDSTFIVENIAHLKNLIELTLECNCQLAIEGLNRLTKLRKLRLLEVDVRSIPNIKSLKTLYASHSDLEEFNCLGKFPNLENLKIEGFSTIDLGKLPKLKVLVMGAPEFDLENAGCFDHLPNLAELKLRNCDISALKKIGQLKNLKILDVSENFELANIDELEGLKSLERLNLYDNNISDISVLNKLPNLKQVNLALNKIEEEEVPEQLDNPEIACFMGYPSVPFFIGGKKMF